MYKTSFLASFFPIVGLIALVLAPLAAQTTPWTESGMASWYGAEFQGRATASGEAFDPTQLSAAHRTLPFGTLVKVLNTANGQSVVVRINDRGPFVSGRIIDLSKAAADKLGYGSAGTIMVNLSLAGAVAQGVQANATAVIPVATAAPATIAVISASPTPSASPVVGPNSRSIQLGAFSSQVNARNLVDKLAIQGLNASIETVANPAFFRVVLSPVEATNVDVLVEKLRGLGFSQVLVRQK